MADEDLLCDQEKCTHLAVSFGFLPDGVKMKVCQDHESVLTAQEVKSFSMTDYHFLESIGDMQLYDQRKVWVQKGMESLTLLTRKCEEEWVKGQARVQVHKSAVEGVVQKTYEEIVARGKLSYEQTKLHIEETRAHLTRLMRDKSFQLTPIDLTRCEAAGAPFRMIVGDCRVQVAETILTHFRLMHAESELDRLISEEMEQGRKDIACEISLYARELGYENPDFEAESMQLIEEKTRELTCLLHTTATEQEVLATAGQYLDSAQSHISQDKPDTAVSELEQGRTLLKLRGFQDSALWLQLTNALAEVHCMGKRQTECEDACEEVLNSWGKHKHTFELWRAAFILTFTVFMERRMGRIQTIRAVTLLEEWTGKLDSDDPLCHSISLICQAVAAIDGTEDKVNKCVQEVESHREALTQSFISAVTLWLLGILYWGLRNLPLAESTLSEACSVFESHYKGSFYYGMGLVTLSGVLGETGRKEEAVVNMKTAQSTLERFGREYEVICEQGLKHIQS